VVNDGAGVRRVTAGWGRDQDRPTLRDGGDPADSRSPAVDLCRPQVLSLSLSLSLSLLSFDVSMMQGSEDRPDFESEFGFLLFWFDDFWRVAEWASFCCLGLMAGELVFFVCLISGD
jgi:hypothetical protein